MLFVCAVKFLIVNEVIMKRGRPRKPADDSIGRPIMPDWLSAKQREVWNALMRRDCSRTWGSAQTELVVSLVVSMATLEECNEKISAEGITAIGPGGLPHAHPAVTMSQRERGLIATIAAKLGLAMNGRIGTRKAKPKAGKSAAEFLTMTPRIGNG
jgi:P27 family predicted phage terminase small subunit